MKRLLTIILSTTLLIACTKKNDKVQVKETTSLTRIKYASGFSVTAINDAKLVEVSYPFQGATSGYKYLLVPKGSPVPEHDNKTRVILTPLSSIVCTSTTHIPFLDYLDETNALTGFPSTDYISSEKMRQRIDAGHVQELGIGKGINLEKLVVLKPDVVMGYTVSSDYGQFKKIEELGINVIINAEYLEKNPLGRAEWIKFVGLFFDKEKLADSIFNQIEKDYNETKSLVDSVAQRPTVLSGIVYSDAWFLPGGQNYASTLFKDAGHQYLWADNPSQGFLQLSFETVYEKANNVDLWIGVGTFESLKEIKNADHRYTKFKPFITKQVYTFNKRKGAKGGSEFMELGYLRPDIILKDLVKIAHPHVLPDHELFFHRKLE